MSDIDVIPGLAVGITNHVQVTWQGEHRFDAGRPGGPTIRVDASAKTGPGPVDTLLSALASCTAVDIVDILAKRRTPVESLAIDVKGARSDGTPRRVIGIMLTYNLTGAGIDRAQAERAIELSVTKYCSVRDSLDPNMPVRWQLVLNGE